MTRRLMAVLLTFIMVVYTGSPLTVLLAFAEEGINQTVIEQPAAETMNDEGTGEAAEDEAPPAEGTTDESEGADADDAGHNTPRLLEYGAEGNDVAALNRKLIDPRSPGCCSGCTR